MAQLVASLISDQTVVSLIPILPHTFLETDQKTIFYGHSSHCANSKSVVISYKRMYVHYLLVNRYVKLVPEKCG